MNQPATREFWNDAIKLEDRHQGRGVRVRLTPSDLEEDAVDLWISTQADRRREGLADQALIDVVALADKHHVSLALVASPTEKGDGLPNADRLAHWYGRHGFVRSGNTTGGIVMRRDPGPQALSD